MESSTAIIIQARMASRRLPGKVLLPIGDKPLLQLLIERMQRAEEVDHVMVATSDGRADDPIEQLCRAIDVDWYRGSLENTADRLYRAALSRGVEVMVRVSGDSPFLDVNLVDRAVMIFRNQPADLVTNVFPRTFPRGQSVEVLATETLGRALPHMDAGRSEHVTKFFYDIAEDHRIINFEHESSLAHLNFTVDTERDLSVARALRRRFRRPHWSYSVDELVALADANGIGLAAPTGKDLT
jgi:spore coat polysaccharide biosynthesis protein SpsF